MDTVENEENITAGMQADTQDRILARFVQHNKFPLGEQIEIMKPDGRNEDVEVLGMYDAELKSVGSCPHSKQVI